MALAAAPQSLVPFHGPARGFSFAKEIQPILDRHCIGCHHDREPVLALAAGEGERLLQTPRAGTGEKAFSLLGDTVTDERAKRKWSDAYLVLTESKRDGRGDRGAFRGHPDGRLVKWISSQSAPTPQAPFTAGSTQSELLTLLESGHGEVTLSRGEMEKIACWIDLSVPFGGDYLEGNAWSESEMEKYLRYADKRRKFEAIDRESVRRMREGR